MWAFDLSPRADRDAKTRVTVNAKAAKAALINKELQELEEVLLYEEDTLANANSEEECRTLRHSVSRLELVKARLTQSPQKMPPKVDGQATKALDMRDEMAAALLEKNAVMAEMEAMEEACMQATIEHKAVLMEVAAMEHAKKCDEEEYTAAMSKQALAHEADRLRLAQVEQELSQLREEARHLEEVEAELAQATEQVPPYPDPHPITSPTDPNDCKPGPPNRCRSCRG